MSGDIIFLPHRLPFPPDKGDKIRSHAILTHLARRHRVHVGCFVDDARDLAYLEDVRRIAGGECCFVRRTRVGKGLRALGAIASGSSLTTACFGSARLQRWVDTIARQRQVRQAVLFGSAMAQYVLNSSELAVAASLLDMVDVDSDKWRQYQLRATGPQRWVYRREHQLLGALERHAALAFGATLFVSPYEARCFQALVPEAAGRIHAVNNGVNLQHFDPEASYPNPFGDGEQAVVMTGTMDYRPNIDAADWFAREVMPSLLLKSPRLRFHIVGANPPTALQRLAGETVAVTGRVDDIRPYLKHAAAVVAPLRIARGVPNKVLEAMAMRRPVVATSAVARALELTPGIELWIEDDPMRFGDAVLEAIDDSIRDTIAQAGRAYVDRNHVWESNLQRLDELLAGLTEPGMKAVSPATSVHLAPSSGTLSRLGGQTAEARSSR